MNTLRHLILWLVLLLILGMTNWSIFEKENLLANGEVVLLELAPVDPRSLIQGDYMALRYALGNNVDTQDWPNRGSLVIQLDANGVATLARLHDPAQPVVPTELLLAYRKRGNEFDPRGGGNLQIGSESFFFQEGHARYYENAEYGEFRVTTEGESLLVGLRDQGLQQLGPPQD